MKNTISNISDTSITESTVESKASTNSLGSNSSLMNLNEIQIRIKDIKKDMDVYTIRLKQVSKETDKVLLKNDILKLQDQLTMLNQLSAQQTLDLKIKDNNLKLNQTDFKSNFNNPK